MLHDLHGLIITGQALSARLEPDAARPADIILQPWRCDGPRFERLAELAMTLPPLLGSPPGGKPQPERRAHVAQHEGRWLTLMARRVMFAFDPHTRQLHRLVRDSVDISLGEDLQCGSYWAIHAALQGRVPLHASALDLPDGAGCLLLAAASGQGKSSTTASLVMAGASVRSDDVVTLRQQAGSLQAEAGSLTLRMRQPLNAVLPEHLSARGRSGDNRYLYEGSRQLPALQPVRGLLFPRLDQTAEVITLKRLAPLDVFRALADEPRVISYLPAWQNQRVALLSALIASAPAWQVTLPNHQRDLARQGPALMSLLLQALADSTP